MNPSWTDTNSCCTTSVSERWGQCAATWGKKYCEGNTVSSEVAQLIALIRLTLPYRTEWTLCVSAVLGHRGILCAAFTVWQSRETNTDVTFFAEVWGLKSRVVLFFLWRAYQWPSGQTVSITQPLATTSRPTQIKSRLLRTRGRWKIQQVEVLKTIFVLSSSRANQGWTVYQNCIFYMNYMTTQQREKFWNVE